MRYLLDTNAISDLARGELRIAARLRTVPPDDELFTSTIVVGELRYGLSRMPPSHRRSETEARVGRHLAALHFQGVNEQVAERYAVLKLARETHGRPMGENDLWIAASAIELGAVLVTRDGDFANTPGLAVQDWTAP